MIIVKRDKLIVKSWCENPENSATDQALDAAALPFIFRLICLMPDTHAGYGVPIGSVIATEKVVIPNAVGVDIGCGVAAVNSNLNINDISTVELKDILSLIRQNIPTGFKKHSNPVKLPYDLEESLINLHCNSVSKANRDNISLQLGTLGGGNHFLEIQKDSEGYIWIMVHSGSRNLGKQICDHYSNIAAELNNQYFNYTKDLGFLPINSTEGLKYLEEMNFALEFAKANRNMMLGVVKYAFNVFRKIEWGNIIDVQHNYAAIEHHYGKNVIVHRKGAIRARENEIGIIPGSQGTASYIVRGKGSSESFMSCSHGAGRKMSRTVAKNTLDLQEEIQKMEEKGIIHGILNKDDLDEAASAYKDIDVVMEEQKDLVDIMVKLTPVAVIKG